MLALSLNVYARHPGALVLALPRGGVPVGFAIAHALEIPLDILLVRKLGLPGHEEYAMGAIASGGLRVVQTGLLEQLGVPMHVVDDVAQCELRELERRELLYRGNRPPVQLGGRIVILVDDGLATGSTMLAAVQALRKKMPARVIVAVPVAASDTCEMLNAEVDEIICLRTPEPFYAVGIWYEDFGQTTDQEVKSLLDAAEKEQAARMQEDGAAKMYPAE